jgi:FG-GAP repeat protein
MTRPHEPTTLPVTRRRSFSGHRDGSAWAPPAALVLLLLGSVLSAPDVRAAGSASPDFNGDGFADLVVGAPYSSVARRGSGAVHVFPGSATGLRRVGRQLWSLASPGITDRPGRYDQFGWSVAHGDFDGDGFDDLAIGGRWEDTGARNSGAVRVLYGSGVGLTAEGAQSWHQDSPDVRDRSEPSDQFGWAVVAADFDRDGFDDLAVGMPFEDVRARDAGAVQVLYGTPTGLRAARDQLWHQGRTGIADRPEAGDHFGVALAAGDFDGDGGADLAIGAAYEDRRVHRAGIVHIIHGTRHGLTARRSQVWHQDSPGIRERASKRDQFGQSLAAGDVDRDGFDDLVVGVWFEDYRNALSNEGGFHVIHGTRRGLTARRDQFWHEDRPGIQDQADDSDRFGQALGVADVDGDGFDDIVVGSPSSDLHKGIHQNRGAVHVFHGSRRGITERGDLYLDQDQPGVMGHSEAFAWFGASVDGADFDGDGFDDLAVGIPYKDLEVKDEGAVYVIHGSRRGLDRGRETMLQARGSGQRRSERREARFGWSVSGRGAADGSPRLGRPDL